MYIWFVFCKKPSGLEFLLSLYISHYCQSSLAIYKCGTLMSLCQLELGDCSSLPVRLGLSGFGVFLLLIYKTFGNLSTFSFVL